MRLSQLLKGIAYERIVKEDLDMEIQALSADSREEMPSSLFFCLQGKTDGHAYAQEAVKNGAVAVVCMRELPIRVPQVLVRDTREALAIMSSTFYGDPSREVQVVGVTGTNGKTTTTYMLSALLKASGRNVGVIGTLGVCYNGQTYPSPLTTPDPIFLQKTLAQMRAEGVECAVMEVSAHALHYNKVAGVRFSACILSNLTQDHLDFFPTMYAYGEAKKKLFSPEVCPLAILNADDGLGEQCARLREGSGAKTVTYGLQAPADAFAVILEEKLTGCACLFNVQGEMFKVQLPFLGAYNVYNALSATVCALALGVESSSIENGFASMQGVRGRLERVTPFQGGTVFVDFAHTPDGLKQSLSALKKHCKGKLICVFGCGGNRDKSKRHIMGRTVAELADFAVLTADNPRFEDPLDIISCIERGYRECSNAYVVIPKRELAIEYAMERMQEGDILLVAGKGGERYQEIMGIKYPFEDNAIIERFAMLKTQSYLS